MMMMMMMMDEECSEGIFREGELVQSFFEWLDALPVAAQAEPVLQTSTRTHPFSNNQKRKGRCSLLHPA